jgi:cytochrome c-type biogenesis protein CcmI
MTMWLLPFGILLLATAAGLLLPALFARSSPSASRAERASAVLRDKLAQVARDREVGLIGPDEAVGAEAEISRALIASTREVEAESAGSPPGRGGWAGIALIAILALGGSVELYRFMGSYDLPDQPLAARDTGAGEAAPTLLSEHDGGQMNDAITALRARLEQEPGNAEQWLL